MMGYNKLNLNKQFTESNSEQREILEQAKRNLDNCSYDRVEEEYLQEKIANIQSASQSMQSGLAWATTKSLVKRPSDLVDY